MKIGWTLNVIIMEAELARDERKWYLEQALCRGWSKTQLLKAIHSGADSMKYLEQFDSSEKQVNQVAVENPVFIVEVMRDIHTNDDFFEKILRNLAKTPCSDCSMGRGGNTGVRSSQQAQQASTRLRILRCSGPLPEQSKLLAGARVSGGDLKA